MLWWSQKSLSHSAKSILFTVTVTNQSDRQCKSCHFFRDCGHSDLELPEPSLLWTLGKWVTCEVDLRRPRLHTVLVTGWNLGIDSHTNKQVITEKRHLLFKTVKFWL